MDECQFNMTKCGPNTDCINTNGSFFCECKAGYKGINGEACTGKYQCLVYLQSQSKINFVLFKRQHVSQIKKALLLVLQTSEFKAGKICILYQRKGMKSLEFQTSHKLILPSKCQIKVKIIA